MLKEMLMKKTLAAFAAAATVATALAAAPTPANAGCWGGCAVGAGVLGFVAVPMLLFGMTAWVFEISQRD